LLEAGGLFGTSQTNTPIGSSPGSSATHGECGNGSYTGIATAVQQQCHQVSWAMPEVHLPGDSRHLPTEFRLQLQVLDHIAQQSKAIRQLQEQQYQWVTQLTSMQRTVNTNHESMERQVSNHSELMRQLEGIKVKQNRMNMLLERTHKKPSVDFADGSKDQQGDSVNKNNSNCSSNGDNNRSNNQMFNATIVKQRVQKSFSRNDVTEHFCAEKTENKRMEDDIELDMLGVDKVSMGTRLVRSIYFESTCAAVIIFNAAMIGVTSDRSIHFAVDNPGQILSEDKSTKELNYAFAAFYTSELLLKLSVFGRHFFNNSEWKWNIFDLVLVLTAIWDVIADIFKLASMIPFTWMRVIRLMKMLKMLRVVRVMRFFKELRTMLTSICGSISTLFWSICMLILMMYIFGLCFLQATTTYLNENSTVPEQTLDGIKNYWSSVPQATVTLYMAITGGADWEPLADPIKATGAAYYSLFLFFIAFASVAVLNVLTGMFVDAAMQVANVDSEMVSEELMESDAPIIKAFTEYMKQNNDDHGMVSWEVLWDARHAPIVVNFLNAFGIDLNDAFKIFKILDLSGRDGGVPMEEFISGCLKMRNESWNMDMVQLLQDQKRMMTQVHLFMEWNEEKFNETHCLFQSLGAPESCVEGLFSRLAKNKCLPSKWHSTKIHMAKQPDETTELAVINE